MSTPVPTEEIRFPPTTVTTFFTNDGTGDSLTFEWTRRMPENGYLGNVTFRQFQKKPIQVFDPKIVVNFGIKLGISWAFQARDGSFICRMFVSNFNDVFITFSDRKKGDWPLVTVFAHHHANAAGAGDQASQSA